MSGGLSVLLAIAALWISNDAYKVGFGILAFVCFVSAAYQAWKAEREKLIAVLPDLRRKPLALLRAKGVAIRNAGQKQKEATFKEWLADTEKWDADVLAEIRKTDEADAEWFDILDAVPEARVQYIPYPGDQHRHIKAMREHDYRLVKLEQLIQKYGNN
jgi:hypothetical protein